MADQSSDDVKIIEQLLFDKDLERLESLIAEFNIFEAVGAVRQEVRHSDFLSFLLDPNQTHGLGDTVLKRMLMRILADASSAPISAIDIDLMHLDQAEVTREWHSIDIFVDDPHNNLVVIIENKIDSSEHSNQLSRYLEIVQKEKLAVTVIPIFLTPDGDTPSHDAYLPVSYETIASVIEDICNSFESTIGQDVFTLMTHYTTMLRRHIVSDSEIAELSRKIYRNHQRTLDLIFENRPDLLTDISDYLQSLVSQTDGLLPDYSSKSYIRFCLAEWDIIPALKTGKGWTRSARILLFEFANSESRLILKLVIGPGDPNVRQRLFAVSADNPRLFKARSAQLSSKWNQIYNRSILTRNDLENSSLEELTGKIDQAWDHFLAEDLLELRNALNSDTIQ